MIRVLVCDDEPLARARLRRLLSAHPDVDVVGEAASGRQAAAETLRLRPDLVLLDVDMPDGSGTDALAAIRRNLPEDRLPAAVFTTAHAEHAVAAFALEGLDYLLKPIEEADLDRALLRVRRRVPHVPPTPPSFPHPQPAAHLAAFRGDKVLNLDLADIALIELEDTIAFAVTSLGRFRLQGTLLEIEARLPSPPYLRVSRDAIVRVDRIAHLVPEGAGVWTARLRPPFDREVQVARRRVARLREVLGW
jgi:two-component system LytT family response regulator